MHLHTTDQAIEQEIIAKGKTAPRITPGAITAAIKTVHYFTAYEGVKGTMPPDCVAPDFPELSLLTFCVLVLQNGFTVTGESACASPENFDAEIGRKIALDNAKQKLWPLLGYELKGKLHAASLLDDGRPVQLDPCADDSVDYDRP